MFSSVLTSSIIILGSTTVIAIGAVGYYLIKYQFSPQISTIPPSIECFANDVSE